jgi:hypothetical protein
MSQSFGYPTSITEMRAQVEALNGQVEELETKSLSLRKEMRMINIALVALQKFSGGNKDIDAIVNKVQNLMMLLMRARMLMMALQVAEAGALGPMGWVYAGFSAAGFGMALTTLGQ